MSGSASVNDVIAEAVAHHRTGRLDEAERIYRAALALEPDHADANHNLGILLRRQGRLEPALAHLRKALRAVPTIGRFWLSLAETLIAADLSAEAVAVLAQGRRHGLAGEEVDRLAALALATVAADEQFTRALAHHTDGRLDQAEAEYRLALASHPDHAPALGNLGALLKDRGRPDEALEPCRRACALRPLVAEGHNNLGAVLLDLGRLEEALARFGRALELRPDYARAQRNLANTLKRLGRQDEAVAAFRRHAELVPDSVESHSLLGMALRQLGRLEDATDSLRQALRLDPTAAGLWAELGVLLITRGRLDEAVEALSRSLEIAPDQPEVICALAGVLLPQGHHAEAMARLENVIEHHPDLAKAHRNLLLALCYGDAESPDAAFAPHRRFGLRFSHPLPTPFANSRDPERRLRVGYLSSDFRAHSVARNLIAVFQGHDRSAFEIHAYAEVDQPDEATKAFQACSHGWHSTLGLSDREVAERIRADGIDILVCLAGRFDRNRPSVCGQRAAPIQISFHDIATSGLEEMDYLLADPVLVPRSSPERFTERVLRLPHFYVAEAPLHPPALRIPSGPVVFGCFNNPAKMSPRVLDLWAELLSRCPESRLFLKYFNWFESEPLRQRVIGTLASHGVSPDRLMLHTQVGDTAHHLDLYNLVDIALDPFPFSGSTTSFEALVMGVPVVTLRGDTMAGRWGASMLTSLGLPELIADTPTRYLDIALALAAEGNRSPTRRQGLRQRVLRSRLCDLRGRTRQIERFYRAAWRRWCRFSTSGG